MLGKLIPLFLALIGLAAGTGAGLALRPAADQQDMTGSAPHDTDSTPAAEPNSSDGHGEVTDTGHATVEYVKMNNQFVVPLLDDGRIASLVILSLSLEVAIGNSEAIYAREPKLRDAFLSVMFDHANAGGFRGVFTDASNLTPLRNALTEMARKTMGDMVHGVLISDIARQDN
jgi:hypothetical protein